MRKIVIFDVHGEDKQYYRRTFKNVFKAKVECTEEPLTEITAKKYHDATVVSVSLSSHINAKVFNKMSDLEYIAARTTGVDHIDIQAAKRHHVLVSTVPAYDKTTVAEHTIMLLLALARHLHESTQQVNEGLVDYSELIGYEIAGKTIGVIGCGQIGRQVARVAAGLDMRVIGYDPSPGEDPSITYVSFKELLEKSDVVTLHAPASEETHHMINIDTLSRLKKGAVILNTADGRLVDLQALIDALFSGQVSAAGLDVLEGEQLLRFEEEVSLLHPETNTQDLFLTAEHNVLLRMPNVIITPHNAFNSHESLQRIRHATADNIKQYLMHNPQNLINKK